MRFLTWLATAGLLASALAIGCNHEAPTNSNTNGPVPAPNHPTTMPQAPPPPSGH